MSSLKGRIKPGDPRCGRKPGSVNKTTREIREFSRAILERPEYVASLKARLDAGEAPHMESLLFYYGYGKPKETIEHSVDESLYSAILRSRVIDQEVVSN